MLDRTTGAARGAIGDRAGRTDRARAYVCERRGAFQPVAAAAIALATAWPRDVFTPPLPRRGSRTIFRRCRFRPDFSTTCAAASRWRRSSGGRSPGTAQEQPRPRRLLGALPVPSGKIRRRSMSMTPRATTTASAATPRATRSPSCARPRTSASWRRWSGSPREAGMPMPERDPAAAARAAARTGWPRRWRPRSSSTACSSTPPAPPRRAPISTAAASTPAARDRFELGFAPDGRTALLDHLTGKGFAREKLVEAGLVGAARRRRQPLRPLPRPHHLPDPRRPRPRHRLRRPRASPPARSRST